MAEREYIELGKISGLFGIKGCLKVYSFTEPRENILNYSPWRLVHGRENIVLKVLSGQRQGKNVVACLESLNDRESASKYLGWVITILRDQLPPVNSDEYYWSDLVGLEVVTTENTLLGAVSHLIETGANDVLVVKGDRDRLIPFLQGQSIVSIDLDQKRIVVDWDPDF